MSFDWANGIFEKYEALAQKDISLVPEPSRTVMAVFSAHGVIGNGGFKMLFESNLMDGKGLEIIIRSYRNIGLEQHAQEIEALVSLFPNSELPNDINDRYEFISNIYSGENIGSEQFDKTEEFFFKNHEEPYELVRSYYESKNI